MTRARDGVTRAGRFRRGGGLAVGGEVFGEHGLGIAVAQKPAFAQPQHAIAQSFDGIGIV